MLNIGDCLVLRIVTFTDIVCCLDLPVFRMKWNEKAACFAVVCFRGSILWNHCWNIQWWNVYTRTECQFHLGPRLFRRDIVVHDVGPRWWKYWSVLYCSRSTELYCRSIVRPVTVVFTNKCHAKPNGNLFCCWNVFEVYMNMHTFCSSSFNLAVGNEGRFVF